MSRRVLLHVALIVTALVMIYPLLWMVSSSVKPEAEIFTDQSLIPSRTIFDNYRVGWQGSGTPFGSYLLNSAIIAGLAIVGNLMSCSMVAYAFARLEFPAKKLWFALMMATVMLPQHVTLVPQYILFVKLGWADTPLPMVTPKFLAVDA